MTLDEWFASVRHSVSVKMTFESWVRGTGFMPADVARAIWDFAVGD